jgi:hypothetical protein
MTDSITYQNIGGPGSSVGIATDYGLDGPGSNPGGDEIFRPSRPALGPTQSPVQWLPGLSRGWRRSGRGADPQPPSSAEVIERVELYLYSP